jgi:hypothetical protein
MVSRSLQFHWQAHVPRGRRQLVLSRPHCNVTEPQGAACVFDGDLSRRPVLDSE